MYENWFLIVIPSLRLTDFLKEKFKFCECSISEWSARKIGRKHSAATEYPPSSKPRNTPHRIHQIPHCDPVALRQFPIAFHQFHFLAIEPASSTPQGQTRKDSQHFGDALYFRHGRCPSKRQRKLQKTASPSPFSAASSCRLNCAGLSGINRSCAQNRNIPGAEKRFLE